MYNQSDESVVARWMENPCWQYFSGEEQFQWNFPCDRTELVKFLNRISSEGVEKIFEVSIKMHGSDGEEDEVIADTTCHNQTTRWLHRYDFFEIFSNYRIDFLAFISIKLYLCYVVI